jgi:hypothetical protein
MTDLNTKFTGLESQLADQHTVISDKLDALLNALQATEAAECTNYYPTSTAFTLTGNFNGYTLYYPESVQLKIDSGIYANMPAHTTYTFSVNTSSITIRDINDYDLTLVLCAPPASGATLTSIVGLLSTMSTALLAMQTSNEAYHTASLSILDTLSLNIETTLQNNSLNAQRMIAALYATFCPCTDGPVLIGPPLSTVTISLEDQAKCRRIQFYLALFTAWLDKIAIYGGAGASVTGAAIGGLLGLAIAEAGLVGGEIGAVAGPPGIIVGAVVGLIIGAIYTFGGAVLQEIALAWHDETLQATLLAAMFAATNADEGNVAFHETVQASDIGTIAEEIIYTLFWAGWANDIYSDDPVIDDSAFDGTICSDILWDRIFTEIYSATNPAFDSGDIEGWSSYHLVSTATAGSILIHVWIDGVDTHTWSGNHEEYFDTDGVVKVILSFPGFAAGTVYLEGSPSIGG